MRRKTQQKSVAKLKANIYDLYMAWHGWLGCFATSDYFYFLHTFFAPSRGNFLCFSLPFFSLQHTSSFLVSSKKCNADFFKGTKLRLWFPLQNSSKAEKKRLTSFISYGWKNSLIFFLFSLFLRQKPAEKILLQVQEREKILSQRFLLHLRFFPFPCGFLCVTNIFANVLKSFFMVLCTALP